jgi:carbon storage regulator
MLVLSRQKDQTIMIGDLVEITIVEVRGDKVRLGITAPVSIPVHRKEVYQAIQRENQEASRAALDDIAALQRLIGSTAEKAVPSAAPLPPARAEAAANISITVGRPADEASTGSKSK